MKTYFIVIILIIAAFTLSAQDKNPNDTVFIKVDSSLQLKIYTVDYATLSESPEVRFCIKNFQADFNSVYDKIKFPDHIKIEYRPNDYLIVDSLKTPQKFCFREGFLSGQEMMNQCRIFPAKTLGCGSSTNYSVIIYFKDVSALLDTSLQSYLNRVIDSLPEKTRRLMNLYFEYSNDQKSLTQESSYTTPSIDQMEFTGGFGLAFIKNQPVVFLDFQVGVKIGYKGLQRHSVYIRDDINYTFDDEDLFTLNNFLGVGYGMSVTRERLKNRWLGIEAAMLTNKKSNFFSKNTFRLSIWAFDGQYFTWEGQLYFVDDFKRVFPGLAIGFTF